MSSKKEAFLKNWLDFIRGGIMELVMRKYKILLEERRKWYKSIKKVYCPVLKEDVYFTSKGFYHLTYPSGKMRPIKEQMYKLGLLPLLIPVIKNARKIEEYKKSFIKGKEVESWVLRETVGRQKTLTKVVLKRVGTGKITFLSVMKKRDKKLSFKIKKALQRKWPF